MMCHPMDLHGGYIGSCIPFVAGVLLVLFGENIGLSQMQAMTIAFIIVAI